MKEHVVYTLSIGTMIITVIFPQFDGVVEKGMLG